MDISKLSVGKNPPEDVNVIIEIPLRADPVKYEFDKESGFIFVDRMLSTAMHYPCNYGFVPKTLSEDGDPIDALVIADLPLIPGSVINCRPIGVLVMEDEAGGDEKLLCVPSSNIAPSEAHVKEPKDIPEILLMQIKHYFEHYKDLEGGKWVQAGDFQGSKKAKAMIVETMKSYIGIGTK